jgi:hypothetical protein
VIAVDDQSLGIGEAPAGVAVAFAEIAGCPRDITTFDGRMIRLNGRSPWSSLGLEPSV